MLKEYRSTQHPPGKCLAGANAMRSVLALGLLITLWAPADAATVHRARRPEVRWRPVQRVTIPDVPKGYAVPGWTDAQTRQWLDNATGPKD
jgi:hypothetical protein